MSGVEIGAEGTTGSAGAVDGCPLIARFQVTVSRWGPVLGTRYLICRGPSGEATRTTGGLVHIFGCATRFTREISHRRGAGKARCLAFVLVRRAPATPPTTDTAANQGLKKICTPPDGIIATMAGSELKLPPYVLFFSVTFLCKGGCV